LVSDRYIKKGSECEINVSSVVFHDLETAYAQKDFERSTFDAALNEILKMLLLKDILPRYHKEYRYDSGSVWKKYFHDFKN
jgi:hypothetical protein